MICYQKELNKKLEEYRGKKLYLYGAMRMGSAAYHLFSHYCLDIEGYIVTRGGSGFLNGIPVRNIDEYEFTDTRNIKVILTLNDIYHDEVKKLLHQKGIFDIDDSYTVTQNYFLSEIYREIFNKNNICMDQNVLQLGNVKIPNPYIYSEMESFWVEAGDLLIPQIFQDERFLADGMYEYDCVKLEAGDVVFDCGANIGLFSAYAAAQGCKVYAFEPQAEQLGAILKLCSELNGKRISHIPCALADQQGTAQFVIDQMTDQSRLLSGELSKYRNTATDKVVNVDVTTIDSFVESNNLKSVDFIKADIEGAERQMLRGAVKVLRKFAPKLAICTYHCPDDPQVLEAIIKSANPNYKVVHKWFKLFAYV